MTNSYYFWREFSGVPVQGKARETQGRREKSYTKDAQLLTCARHVQYGLQPPEWSRMSRLELGTVPRVEAVASRYT